MRIEPVLNRVIVIVEAVEEVTKSGIVIPKTTQENQENTQEVGEIVEVGPQAYNDWGGPEMATNRGGLNVGDKVLFARQGGKSVRYGDLDKRLRVLNDTDIVAVIREED